MFEYQMVQVPPNVQVKTGHGQGAAATYLQGVVDQHASQGWEFYSIETIGVVESPGCGCLAALFGIRTQVTQMYVVVFRRTKAS